MRRSSSAVQLRRLALLALDVAGVAQAADDAFALLFRQRAERLGELGQRAPRRRRSGGRCRGSGAASAWRSWSAWPARGPASRSQATVSRSGRSSVSPASTARRIRAMRASMRRFALVVEDAEALGDRREALVDGVAAEEQAMLRAGGEHPVRLLGAEGDEVVDHHRGVGLVAAEDRPARRREPPAGR